MALTAIPGHPSAGAAPGTPAAAQDAGAQRGALPRTADGKPDLSGVWQVLATAAWDIQDHQAGLGVPAGQGVVEGNDIPYQPWALAKKQENFKNRRTAGRSDGRSFTDAWHYIAIAN